ncbi:SET and MYND domain-containing protein 4-like isoform X3 [Pomacea canaliculata]|uniref:SET and MYND domain-containing protein 4-like isoform X3 n=1 Tax=Pomacea canaliculata TaxID=400727 RepID=UPI000D73A0BE|nr:SET and MYND domain-containing protein 4-like isoform X3 [Pomacea canaliculata]
MNESAICNTFKQLILLLHRNVSWLKFYFRECCSQFHTKSGEKAAQHRSLGNKLFQEKKYQAALLHYTKSVQFAPSSMNDLALAYGNRSAVLFHQLQYQECLTDITRAMEARFPTESIHKLHIRRCRCFLKLGRTIDARAEMDILHLLADKADSKETKEIISQELKKLEKDLIDADTQLIVNTQAHCEFDLSVSHEQNDILVQASSAICLKMSSSQGRFLEAKYDISAGDTLIVERPFAAVLLPDHYSTHCHNCFVRLPVNPIGCQRCSHVLFCHEDCRDVSWRTFHSVECPYLDILHSVGIAHLALRIVVTAGLRFLLEFLQDEKQRSGRVPGLTPEGRYERNYLTVFDLMTHTDDMMLDDLFQYSLTAALLLGILVHSGWLDSSSTSPSQLDTHNGILHGWEEKFTRFLKFIKDEEAEDEQDEEEAQAGIVVGGLLLRHIQQLVCNAHAITTLQTTQADKENAVQLQSQVRIATAIYPTASLMNHSCDPTIISSFHKDILVVKSIKDISAGGEIFNCYGPHWKRMKLKERQEILKTQYFFDCQCEPCLKEEDGMKIWDTVLCQTCGNSMSVQQKADVCSNCHVTCDVAAMLSELQVGDKHFTEGIQRMEFDDHQRAMSSLEACLKIREKLLTPDHHDLGQVHDAMAQCFAMTGQYGLAADHLSLSVTSAEAMFGVSSLEVARELHKMAEVQVSAGRPAEALTSATRALQLARTHYVESSDWVQELLCFQMALSKLLAK